MDRTETLLLVRDGFNAAAEAMNAGGAALRADGGTDLLPVIGAFNNVAIALNKAIPPLRAVLAPRVIVSWAAAYLPEA